MTAHERLAAARRVFLDTAPVIYYVEAHPRYLSAVDEVFRRLDEGSLIAVTSPVTLAESLVLPLRSADASLVASFVDLLTGGAGTVFVAVDADCARLAAELRAGHRTTLTDAIQLAAARLAGCDLFLTNDADLKRVDAELVLTLDDLLAEVGRAT